METLLFLLFLGLSIWLTIHSSRSNERLSRLETEVRRLRDLASSPPLPEKTPSREEIRPSTEKPLPAPGDQPSPPIPPKAAPASRATTVSKTPPPLPVTPSTPSPPAKPATRKPAPRTATNWRRRLEAIKLWPPSGENAEATIAAWWLSRIGLIILIIGAVFFGVRIAENTPPWVRVTALGAISAGVCLLGTWLEKRFARFGRLISAGGLGLMYFTAFAAYGIEATKVIDQPAIGFLGQATAVLVMIGWSFWKRDEAVAAMAVLLGYVACWFSHAHDLDHFVIAGLLFLATGAGAMLVVRSWLWPAGLATLGSWTGFAILGIAEWPRLEEAPSFPIMLGSLLLLTAILEAANFLAHEHSRSGSETDGHAKWRRRLSLIHSTLAIGTGWLALRSAFPAGVEERQLDFFYLGFAVLFALFTALRFHRRHPVAITETFFLKTSGLLALFFVAWFDGPTRWLSLSIQTGVLLWAWQRSRLRWIEVGFGVLFAGTLAVLVRDISAISPVPADAWEILTIRHLVAILSLTVLSTALALHAGWAPATSPGDGNAPPNSLAFRPLLRNLAAIAIGYLIVPMVMREISGRAAIGPVLLISFAALAMAIPALARRRFAPVLAGLTAFLPACLLFLDPRFPGRETGPGLTTGAWLVLVGLVGAEAAFRRWRVGRSVGNGVRFLLQAVALIVATITIGRGLDTFEPPQVLRGGALFALALLGVFTLLRQGAVRSDENPLDSRSSKALRVFQGLLAIVAGVVVAFSGPHQLESTHFAPSILVMVAGALFLAAFLTKNGSPGIAGGIPLVFGVGWHLAENGGSVLLRDHALAVIPILAVCAGTAITLWRRVDARRFRGAIWCDLALHGLALATIHHWLHTHFSPAEVFLGNALLATALVAIVKRFPLPGLAIASTLPWFLALMNWSWDTLHGRDVGDPWLWWPTAALALAWYGLSRRHFLPNEDQVASPKVRHGVFLGQGLITALALSAVGHEMLPEPWKPIAYGLFSLLLATFALKTKAPGAQAWSAVPLGIGLFTASRIVFGPDVPGQTVAALVSVGIFSLALAGHGVLVTRSLGREARSLSWLHGLAALGLTFFAFAADRFGVESWTTVSWGLAALVLFGIGLAAGLRPYRLTGLIGLAFAIVRMFAIDIEDSLDRIFAAFAIALVLLGIGYLYHRFRHLIERADTPLAADGAAKNANSE